MQLVAGLTRARRSRAGAFLAALRWLVLALFIVALAQPRLIKSTTTVKASGIDIVVALDLSGSMELPDFVVHGQRVNRFDMANSVLSEFIDERPNDRIGLVAFGGQAYIASPLTLDHDFLQENLDRLHLHMIEDNTAIGDALDHGVEPAARPEVEKQDHHPDDRRPEQCGQGGPAHGGGSGAGARRESLHHRHRQ